jgi:hypothetical protein
MRATVYEWAAQLACPKGSNNEWPNSRQSKEQREILRLLTGFQSKVHISHYIVNVKVRKSDFLCVQQRFSEDPLHYTWPSQAIGVTQGK